MRKKALPMCPACGKHPVALVGANQEPGDWCATCLANAEAEPVGGSEPQRLREEAGLTRRELAGIISGRKLDADGESYLSLDERDVARMEGALVHRSLIDRLKRLLNGEEGNMNNGISDESMAIQQAHNTARDAWAAHDIATADAESAVADFDATLDRLLELGATLPDALYRRRETYWQAVQAERKRAKLAQDESRESEIAITPYRRVFRPTGKDNMVLDIVLAAEQNVSVPLDFDPAQDLRECLPEYVDLGINPRPIRRTKP